MNTRVVILSVIGGVILTLLTGLFSNTPPMLVGATHYGYPLAWLVRLVLAPEYFPWQVNVSNLIVDIVIWILIVGIIATVLTRGRKTGNVLGTA